MSIRAATHEDALSILEMVRALYVATKTERNFPFNDSDALLMVHEAIDGPNACAFVNDDGSGHINATILGGLVSPPINRAFRIAQEFVLWVVPGSRKTGLATKLVGAFEEWAASVGAGALAMGFTRGCSESAIGRICKRRGMAPMESLYIKRLGDK